MTSRQPCPVGSAHPVPWHLVFVGAICLMRGEQPLTAIPCQFLRQLSRLLLLRFAGLDADGEASMTPATINPTGNRPRPTAEMEYDGIRSMELENDTSVGGSEAELCELRWKAGVEAPPFLAANTALMQLLKDLVNGSVAAIPAVRVSNAVVVQIYRLIFDKKACSAALKGVARHGLYVILASLALGTRTLPPDDKGASVEGGSAAAATGAPVGSRPSGCRACPFASRSRSSSDDTTKR